MQHKKYQRKYKFSLVFGPTLWGHHKKSVVLFIITLALIVEECYRFRGDISFPWILKRIVIVVAIALAFVAFQKHQEKKYGEESN